MSKYELGCALGKLSHELKVREIDTSWTIKFLYHISKNLKKYNSELTVKLTTIVTELIEKYHDLI